MPLIVLCCTINLSLKSQCFYSFLTFDNPQLNGSNQAVISWTTNTESGLADRFEIERSTDGINYSKVGVVSATANTFSNTSYSFTESNPYGGIDAGTIYYRLKSVNINEIFCYSPIKTLNLPLCNNCTFLTQCQIASISGSSGICSGSSTYKILNSPDVVTWGISNSSIATIQPVGPTNVIVTKQGNGFVTLTASILGCSPSLTKDINIGTAPINSLDIITSFCLAGRNVKLQVNPITPNTTYTWSVTSPATVFPTIGTFTVVRSTILPRTVTVTVQAQNTCGNSSFSQSVFLASCSGFRASNTDDASFFVITPSPANNQIIIRKNLKVKPITEKNFNSQQTSSSVKIYDFNGFLQKEVNSTDLNNLIIDISKLKTGLYVVQIQSNGKVYSHQLKIDR